MPRASFLASLLAVAAFATPAAAQVKAMDLPEMVSVADQAVHGRILSKRVARIDAPDGRTLYYTTMTVEGRLLDARHGADVVQDEDRCD